MSFGTSRGFELGRQVICQDTKTKIDSALLYKAEDGKYYSSEKVFKAIKLNKEYRAKAYEIIWKLLGYSTDYKSTYLFKELAKYSNDYKMLYYTVLTQKEQIQWAIEHKEFASEIYKIKYIMAIINNNMDEERLREQIREHKLSHIKPEEGYEHINEVNNQTKGKGKDVSGLLGEDDWI